MAPASRLPPTRRSLFPTVKAVSTAGTVDRADCTRARAASTRARAPDELLPPGPSLTSGELAPLRSPLPHPAGVTMPPRGPRRPGSAALGDVVAVPVGVEEREHQGGRLPVQEL